MTVAPVAAPPSTRSPAPAPASSSLLRNGYALMCNTGVTAVLGLAYWVLAARLYPPDAIGTGSAVVSALLFVAGVSQLNLQGALTRFLPVAGDRTARFLAGAYGSSATAGILAGGIAVATAGWWAPADSPLRDGPWFGLAFLGAVIAWSWFVLQDSALTALREATWVPVENGVFGLAKIVLLVALAGGTGGAIFASWTIPAAALLVPVNVLLFRTVIPRRRSAQPAATALPSPRALARFVGGDYVGSIFTQALLTLLPLLVVGMLGSTVGGRFYVPWVVATTIDLLPGNLATSFIVESSLAEHRQAAYARTVLRRVAALVVPLALATVVLAPLLLAPFGTGYATESATVLRLLGAATVFRAVSTLYIGVCRAQRRVARLAAVQAAQAVLVLGTAALLLPGLGLVGAGLASLAGQTLVAAFVLPRLLAAVREVPA
jgi:O-antigen/teichoic acid export membrane protein